VWTLPNLLTRRSEGSLYGAFYHPLLDRARSAHR
jgi:hypothetical protein